MRRRETIIVAILVNAALLMILFATAHRTRDREVETEYSQGLVQGSGSSKEELLNQYISALPTVEESKPVAGTPQVKENVQEFPPELLNTLPSVPLTTVTPPQAPAQAAAHFVMITVKKGDVLEKIAKANGTNVAAIMKANQMSTTQLKIGQALKIPLSETSGAQNQSATEASEEFYVVKEGDNPWLIASKNHVKLEQLLQLNELNEERARRLRPGDRLRIR
jgi:peptidoglycan DL-endopeptidase LytF